MTDTFETALSARVAAMADACTRCGKCVEVCPVTGPGGVEAEPRAVIAGIIDILRAGGRLAQMGERLRAQRRMHQGLRLRRQSAFPARHG
jgi:ferredoxin